MSESVQAAVDGVISDLVLKARETASLVGTFDPQKLVAMESDPDTAMEVLRALAKDCDEVESEQGFRWRLNPDTRRSTLSALGRSGRVAEVARKARPEPDDLFGEHLIATVLGRPVKLLDLPTKALAELNTAIQFVAPVANAETSSQQVERVLARRAVESTLRIVLPTKLLGRHTELKRLNDYVFSIPDEVLAGVAPPEPMRVTGIGGAGKSALLAEFVRKLMRPNWGGVPVIWLDLDRAAFATADVNLMLLEFSKQLALYRSDLSERLSRFREQVREGAANLSEDFDSEASFTSSIWSIWQQQLAAVLPLREPVVLIIDTFEEVMVRSESEAVKITRWLEDLHTEGRIYALRPVLSGRILPPEYSVPLDVTQKNQLVVGDLPAAYAGRFLQTLLRNDGIEVERPLCLRLVRKLGGHPLLIKILARYLSEEGGVVAARDILDSENSQQLDERFVNGFIYTRILKRLRAKDPDVEKLAHPGLVLRRVTPGLIEHVLAKPCQLQNMSNERATALFTQLSSQVWLVEHTSEPLVVLHRRDLRRLMLHLMTLAEREASVAIHAGAAAYYQAYRDPYLTEREQDIEAQYHRLFIPGVDLPDPAQLRTLLASVGEDIEEIPVEQRAKLKLFTRRQLTEVEVASLSSVHQIKYNSLQANRKMRSGASVESLNYSQSVDLDKYQQPTNSPNTTTDLSSYIAAKFERADIESLVRAASDVVDEFFNLLESGEASRAYIQDFTETPVWRVALASLGEDRGITFGKLVQSRLEKARYIEWARPINRTAKLGLSAGEGISMLMSLCGIEPLDTLRWPIKPFSQIRTESIEALRASVILGVDNDPQSSRLAIVIATRLLCDLSSTVLNAVDHPHKSFRVIDKGIEEFVESHNVGSSLSLAQLQRKTSVGGYVEFERKLCNSQTAQEVMRGLSPELYPLIRNALSEHSQALIEFSADIESQVWLWPEELKRQNLEASIFRDSQRWTSTLIHFADRCGLLMALVRFFSKRYPTDRAISQMAAICIAYDNQLHQIGNKVRGRP
ncbi:ATP-binding protein [Pseudomonas sp. G5(2012)]|uniref:ATP-binding protein n=1 Tax=Pseudomonas sp. G5(2012) TaxID=1268068 RepID=UPI0003430FA5|nr:ATP-binding protein [Pseudomonas sp. G5(2012)]EPA93649.1 hypothetical protein PG5_58560 [Pseudomonas sp. G5(2012)]